MTIQLYPDGVTVRRVEKGRQRWYEVEGDERVAGVRLRNVTTALNVINKPQLNIWKENQAREQTAAAAKLHRDVDDTDFIVKLSKTHYQKDYAAEGNAAHEKIHQYLTNPETALQEASADDIALFRSVTQTIGESSHIWSEVPVYSAELGFGGTVDLIIEHPPIERSLDPTLSVIDFKTGGVYDEHALQVAAYSLAVEEMSGARCNGYVLQLKDGGAHIKQVKNMDTAKAVFTGVLLIDQWQRDKDVWI